MRTIRADELRATVAGRTLFPGEEEFDEPHGGWNQTVAHAPAVVVVLTSAADVAAAVRCAGDAALPVAVQSTGHGVSVPADGAVFLATRQLTDLTVNATAWTARVGAGLRWGEVVAAGDSASPRSLAPHPMSASWDT